MNLWTIVPVKPLARGKSRLAGRIPDAQREALNTRLLEHTLEVLNSTASVDRILVISSDPAALSLAEKREAVAIPDEGADLNASLRQARAHAVGKGASAILVIPADLPGIHPGAVDEFVGQTPDSPAVVIAPDRHRRGTNALLNSPPSLIEFAFGRDSFARHCASARTASARLVVVENWALALDLDEPEDFSIAGLSLASEESVMILDMDDYPRNQGGSDD